jgi:Holliday junction resolvase
LTGGKAPRQAGDRFERATVDRLRALGYLVIRSAGSLGPADLVALRGDTLPLLVSCKITDNTTARIRIQFAAIAVEAGALAIIATKPKPGHMAFHRITGKHGERIPYDVGGLVWPNPI